MFFFSGIGAAGEINKSHAFPQSVRSESLFQHSTCTAQLLY